MPAFALLLLVSVSSLLTATLTPLTAHVATEHPAYLRAPEVAVFLSISRTQAYRLIENGTLPHIRLGRSVRVPRRALLDYLARNEVRAYDDGTHDR